MVVDNQYKNKNKNKKQKQKQNNKTTKQQNNKTTKNQTKKPNQKTKPKNQTKKQKTKQQKTKQQTLSHFIIIQFLLFFIKKPIAFSGCRNISEASYKIMSEKCTRLEKITIRRASLSLMTSLYLSKLDTITHADFSWR